jgi:hypothetical protein
LPVLIPVAVPVTAKVTTKVSAVIPIMAVAIVAIVAIVVIATIVAVAEGENVRDSHILFLSSVPRTPLLGEILDVPLRGALSATRPLWAALLDRGRGYTDDVDPCFGIAPRGVGGPVGWPAMGMITAPRSNLRVFAGEVLALTRAARGV